MAKRRTAWFRRLLALAKLAGGFDRFGDVEQQKIAKRLGGQRRRDNQTGRTKGTNPRSHAVRKAAKAYHSFVNVDTDELLTDLLLIAHLPDLEDLKKRTPKGVLSGAITQHSAPG
jgi:hypothetical protein